MILVDTSVWIDHFRRDKPELRSVLEADQVLMHPFIVGELACGTLRRRPQILADLDALPAAVVAQHHEVLQFVERHRLWGKGIGWIDCHLLASSILSGCKLWTLDEALERVAAQLRLKPRSV